MEGGGRLGLGADVGEVLEPTVVPGLQVDHHQSVQVKSKMVPAFRR